MSFKIEGFGTDKTEQKSGYSFEQVNEGTKRREEVAFMSLPSLLNGSAHPSQGQQSGQTCFNA